MHDGHIPCWEKVIPIQKTQARFTVTLHVYSLKIIDQSHAFESVRFILKNERLQNQFIDVYDSNLTHISLKDIINLEQ